MGESKTAIVFHLTEREQAVLGRALMRVEAQGREAREKKKRAFGAIESGGFGLDWVRERVESPIEGTVSDSDLLAVFDAAKDATGVPLLAMRAVVSRVVTSLDAFAGRHGQAPIKVTPDRDLTAWVLDALDKLPPKRNQQTGEVDTSDDLVLADIEERIGDARRGTYVLPAELAAPPPTLDIVPDSAVASV